MTPKRRIIPVFVPHLGCPHNCVFCNQRRISGQIEPATADTVTEAIRSAAEWMPQGQQAELAFYGGSFTAIAPGAQEALLGAVQPWIDMGLISGIRLSTRPDRIDAGVLDRLRRFRVETVELGVQSMVEEILIASGRGHSSRQAEDAAALVKKWGFKLILQMMTGLPGDTPERSLYTAKRFAEMAPDGVRVYPTVIIRDTELYDMWRRGEYQEHSLEDAVELCADIMDIFDSAGIPVIRLGLNPTDDLSGGDAVAGAYHPAFGELVDGRRYLKRICALVDSRRPEGELNIGVARGQLSQAVGQRRCNIQALKDKYGFKDVKIRELDIDRGGVVLL